MSDASGLEDYADADIEAYIEELTVTVGPVLKRLFDNGERKRGFNLTGPEAHALAAWIVDLQNMATLYEKQLNALLDAVEGVPEEKPKKKFWTPLG